MIVRGAKNLYPGTLIDPPAGTASLFAGVPEPHGANLRTAEYNGLLDGLIGLGAGWNVYGTATRGEVAQMLYNLLQVLAPAGVWVSVDGSGDYPTIEAAVADISPGTTIYLGPGQFNLSDTLYVDFPFSLVGNGMDGFGATVIAYSSDVVAVGPVDFSAEDIAFVSTAAKTATDAMYIAGGTVHLTRCAFIGGNYYNGWYGSGLNIYGASDVTAVDCSFEQNDTEGVVVDDDSNLTATGCVFDSNGENGAGFFGNATGVIEQSQCTYNGLHGVSANDWSAVAIQDSDCSHNGSGGGWDSGIYFEESSVGAVSNCTASYNSVDGVSCHDDAEVDVDQTVCRYNGEDGITFSENVSGTIVDCDCSYNLGYDGIDVHDNAYAEVHDNFCSHNYEAGIWFGDNASGVIAGNECAYNYYGLLIDLSSNPLVLAGNLLHDNVINYKDDIVWALAEAGVGRSLR